MTTNDTSVNGIHASNGKFAPGNPGGPGNPHAGQVARLRSVLLDTVTEGDIRAIVGKLVEMATGGDIKAAELLLNRTLGKVDSGPSVAVQVNNSGQTSPHDPGRVARIVEQIRARRIGAADKGGEMP